MCDAAGFLHSIAEEYNDKVNVLRAIGRAVARSGIALVRRLTGKGHARYPRTWVELEAVMQPASGSSLAYYRGALQIIYNLAAEFRKRFLGPNVLSPLHLKQLVGVLLGLWTQRLRPKFAFASNQISNARKTFLLSAILHSKA